MTKINDDRKSKDVTSDRFGSTPSPPDEVNGWRFQFNLSTLLIFVTIASVFFALMNWFGSRGHCDELK